MKIPQLQKKPELKSCHNKTWEDNYSWIHQKNMILSIRNWENEYLKENRDKLSKQQIDILEGRELKSHEGMIFGQMYADWKNQKGFNLI